MFQILIEPCYLKTSVAAISSIADEALVHYTRFGLIIQVLDVSDMVVAEIDILASGSANFRYDEQVPRTTTTNLITFNKTIREGLLDTGTVTLYDDISYGSEWEGMDYIDFAVRNEDRYSPLIIDESHYQVVVGIPFEVFRYVYRELTGPSKIWEIDTIIPTGADDFLQIIIEYTKVTFLAIDRQVVIRQENEEFEIKRWDPDEGRDHRFYLYFAHSRLPAYFQAALMSDTIWIHGGRGLSCLLRFPFGSGETGSLFFTGY